MGILSKFLRSEKEDSTPSNIRNDRVRNSNSPQRKDRKDKKRLNKSKDRFTNK